MDFGSVLYTAQKNDENSRQVNGWYKAGFSPPKKEQREKKLSINIQKFLARKETEEKQKQLEAERKKQELLALRSQDKKSVQRVQSMLKRTKSANKSVLEDAVNYENTAVAIAGSLQPDEDDYGYVSKDAEELYNRLIDKYKCGPCENSSKTKTSIKTVKDISTTKDRVKAALQREEDEKLLPRKRKRKAKDGDVNQISDVEDSVDSSSEKVEEKPKSEKFKIPLKNVQTPPPMDFQSLLKLAEKKQHEPIIIQKPIQENPGRPMTQKEKVEYMRERERKIRREMQVTSSNDKLSKPITKESKAAKKPHTISLKSEVQTSRKEHIGLSSCSNQKSSRTVSKISQNEKLTHNLREAPNCKVVRSERPLLQTDKSKPFREFASSGKSETNVENSKICNETIESRLLLNNADLNKKKVLLTKSGKQYYAEQQSKSIMKKFVVNDEDRNSIKAVENPLEKESNRNAKLTMNKSTISRAHSSNVKRIPPPGVIGKNKFSSKLMKRRVIESDDEYDSEMDDFIDDSEDPNDISKYISEIFGYDKTKYARRDEEDDEECMESNFADLEKEEYNSLVTAVKEDLEDVRRTKYEKQKKRHKMSR